MQNAKYTALFSLSLLIVCTTITAFLLNLLFHTFAISIPIAIISQFLIHKYLDDVITKKRISQTIDKYNSLQYKKYLINLECAACKQISPVTLDFDTTEYSCPLCKRENAIYIQIATANKTIIDTDEEKPVDAK